MVSRVRLLRSNSLLECEEHDRHIYIFISQIVCKEQIVHREDEVSIDEYIRKINKTIDNNEKHHVIRT